MNFAILIGHIAEFCIVFLFFYTVSQQKIKTIFTISGGIALYSLVFLLYLIFDSSIINIVAGTLFNFIYGKIFFKIRSLINVFYSLFLTVALTASEFFVMALSSVGNNNINTYKESAESFLLLCLFSRIIFLRTLTQWGEQEILHRLDTIFEYIKAIWSYPEIPVNSNTINVTESFDDEWVSLDALNNMTNRSVCEVDINGTVYSVKNFTEAYKKINAFLCEMDQETFISLRYDNRFINKISCSANNKFRKSAEITPSVFIETNLSNKDKLNNLKRLVKHFDINLQDVRLKLN